MDVRSFRFLMGWSREELAKRSGVSVASVYLFERMGTAGPEDDARIIRLIFTSCRDKASNLRSLHDTTLLMPTNDDTPTTARQA